MAFPEDRPRAELSEIQQRRLQNLVGGLGGNQFWKTRLAEAGWRDLAQLGKRLEDLSFLAELPTCGKQDLVADQDLNPPYGSNLSEPFERYTRLHRTSGTTGRPLRWLDTGAAWSNILEAWAQIFRVAGVVETDRFAFPFSFGPFIGFWAAFEGAAAAGHLCLPGGGMSSAARLRMIEDNHATVVCCTPTYALRLSEVAEEEGFDLRGGPVRLLIVAGEPGGSVPGVRESIQAAWGARVVDHWGMTELGPLAVEYESSPGGMHVLETECIAEIVAQETFKPVPVGEQGEVVITTLRRIGSPVLRYRTGDLVAVDPEPCGCGRALLRLKGGILGRADDMLTIRGNNVFPSSIEAVIRGVSGVAEFRVVTRREGAMDQLQVDVEPLQGADASEVVSGVVAAIRQTFNFGAAVDAVAPGELPRFEMKGRRFVRE